MTVYYKVCKQFLEHEPMMTHCQIGGFAFESRSEYQKYLTRVCLEAFVHHNLQKKLDVKFSK